MLAHHLVDLFVGSQPGGYRCLTGGDGLAVASAAGAFGQVLAEPFDPAEVGFAFVSVRPVGA